jgi:cytochrome c oxidase subunit 2
MQHDSKTCQRKLRPIIFGVFLSLLIAPLWEQVRAQNNSPAPLELKITARRFEFHPHTITVQKGKPVRLVITSEDVEHGFAIDEFDVNVKIEAKGTKVVEFTPDRAGRFRFRCTVFCGDGHEEMTGELVVEEGQTVGSDLKVTFDDQVASVVIVEANGERFRIDTATKTVTRIKDEAAPTPPTQTAKVEQPRQRVHEPYDYRLINVPTPKRVLRHSVNLYFTHRFSQPIKPLDESAEALFGLDSFSVSSLGVFYGITDKLYVSATRSPLCQRGLCRTIEVGFGYHWLDEKKGRSPVALSTYASIEGDDNFTEHYTYNLQMMLARSATKYVNLFFSPAVHFNANGQRRFDPRANEFFPPAPIADTFRQDKHAASFGFGVNARIRPTISLLFEYTPRVGFKLGRVRPIFNSTFTQVLGFRTESEPEIGFGIQKDIGRHSFSLTFSNTQTTTTARYNSSNLVLPASKFIIGFNLYRRFLK